MKTHRWRPLQNWVYETLLNANVGISYPAAGSADAIASANSGGNIAVTPPVQKTANGIVTPYRYGRIYYGHNRYHRVDASSRDFMAAQNMQTPIILDTDWLLVGHVDEMMTLYLTTIRPVPSKMEASGGKPGRGIPPDDRRPRRTWCRKCA